MLPNHLHSELARRFNPARTVATASAALSTNAAGDGYELRIHSLFDAGRGYAFPCDAAGHVDLDALGERARSNYFYARALVGREFSLPAVQPGPLH